MSEAKFNKAVEIIGALPPKGPISPTQAEQLSVRKAGVHAHPIPT